MPILGATLVARPLIKSDAMSALPPFGARVVAWQQTHGRHDLPWQQTQDPYRVWLSEVMLQQTQVATVVAYYFRFLERFPTVATLATASEDEVLALWSGLGYYSRARHLHRCAQTIMTQHGGQFPNTSAALAQLPGIGPSTAAAIASFCFLEPVSIFDGNVQRVLARWWGFADDLSKAAAQKTLHAHAHALVAAIAPSEMPRYTQGLMDLGATVCRIKAPTCMVCPLAADCIARQTQRTAELPYKTKRTKRHTEQWQVLIAQRPDGKVYLIQRPEKGIWAKLWCFPMCARIEELQAWMPDIDIRTHSHALPVVMHALTHKELVLQAYITPVAMNWEAPTHCLTNGAWHFPKDTSPLGLPVPVQRWLAQLI